MNIKKYQQKDKPEAPKNWTKLQKNGKKDRDMETKNQLRILITGANGDCLPPPYGGIIKRCLLHAREWKLQGAEVCMHIHHKHDNEQDLAAGATYFYDFAKKPTLFDKIVFSLKTFSSNPSLFLRLCTMLWKMWPERNLETLYYAGKGVILRRQIKQWNPNVLVTECGAPQSLCAAVIAQDLGLPLVLENYAEMQFKPDTEGKNEIEKYASTWRFLVERCAMIVPASEHCAKGPRAAGATEDRLQIVYSGINFSIFNAPRMSSKSALRESFGLPQDKYLVFAVGALKMRKGHDQLFESILQLPRESLNRIAIALCGMGPVEELRQKAIELGFPKESLFIFQGLTEERLAELYAAMDCFCFPSITPRECMGMAMKEAMSVGLPVAAYDTGGINEAISEGVNGYLAPTGDRNALARALTRIMQLPPDQIKTMSEANIRKAQELFDIQRTSNQLLQILQNICRH